MSASPATWSVVDTDTNAALSASKAGATGRRHYITGFSVSASAAPAAAETVLLKNGSTVVAQYELPAAAFGPLVVNFTSPIRCSDNSAATLEVEALGSGVVASCSIHGFTVYGS